MHSKTLKIFLSFLLILSTSKICNAQIDTLAVMPFQVIGRPTNADIYRYGLPDAIANDLYHLPGITVVERLHLSAVLNELKLSQAGLINERNAPRIGEILGAKMILVGTVQKLGNEVRVFARAVNSISGKVIFGVKADKKIRKFSDVFDLEDMLTQKIIFQFGLKISQKKLDEIKKVSTTSEDAFNLYSSGFKYFDSGNYEKGLKQFQKASEIDKHFDRANQIRARAQRAFEELEREIRH